MNHIAACIDGSAYAASVCDHATWLCGEAGGAVTVLHAVEPGEPQGRAERLLDRARARLQDQGLNGAQLVPGVGAVASAIAAAGPDVVVLGKRGERSAQSRGSLGSNAVEVLRTGRWPVCLVSRVFLPIHRALVIIDAEPTHRQAVETIAANPALRRLDLVVVMMTSAHDDGEAKLTWAQETLGGRAEIHRAEASAPGAAAARYMAEHVTDLIIVSREVLASGPGPLEDGGEALWAVRTPVFVC